MLNLLEVALTCSIIGSFPSAYLAARHLMLLSSRFTRSSTTGVALVFVPLPFVARCFNVPAHVLWFSVGLMLMVGLSHALSERLWPPEGAGVPGGASPGA
jgi:hypothetical protein